MSARALDRGAAARGPQASVDAVFDEFARGSAAPGLVYGVVAGGEARICARGVRNVDDGGPVEPATVFRVASLSKTFTALAVLKLRDERRLLLDAPAERYVPELAALRYPTADGPPITLRALLTHTAGLGNDDAWADRQLALPEHELGRLAAHLPLALEPAFEYSNIGYALLGRAVSNVAGRELRQYVDEEFLRPLGMTSTGYDLARVPANRRAAGYRHERGVWHEEPAQGAGAFAAMGGLATSADDYARFVAWLLAAWPPRDDAEDPILRRASRREIARAQTFAPADFAPPSARGAGYGLGVEVHSDEVLGEYLAHAGGLPGYGADVLLLPRRGLGVFAFANLTYGLPRRVTYAAATALVASGAYPRRPARASRALAAMSARVAQIYAAGDVLAARGVLAANLLLDRDAARRNAEIAELKRRLGRCGGVVSIRAEGALAGVVTLACEHGTLEASIALAPTAAPALAQLELRACRTSRIG